MFKTIVDELIAIKKELQDIKLILKFHFLSNYKTERVKMDGETIINRYILPDPLEELRISGNPVPRSEFIFTL